MTQLTPPQDPFGRLTEQQIDEVVEALAEYLHRTLGSGYPREELTRIAALVVLEHQASHHARVDAVDLRAENNPAGRRLLTMATDAVLDHYNTHRHERQLPVRARALRDDQIVDLVFGPPATPDEVGRVLRQLFAEGAWQDFRVVACFLELTEALVHLPADAEVAEAAGVTGIGGREVRVTMLRFATRLGR